jgi:acetyl esterase/lipase
MTILNRSKIRPDVLKIMDSYLKVRGYIVDGFLKKEGKQRAEFDALWEKLMDANDRHFKGEDMRGYISKEEQYFLAKYHRYSAETGSTYMQKKTPISKDVILEPLIANGVPVEWQIVPSASPDKVLLYFHGGGFIMGSINDHRLFTVMLGRVLNMRVLSVEYRLSPEYPHPAPLEDSTSAYMWLLNEGFEPKNIILAGDSAGGNLTLATLIKLRDDGITLPAGAVCFSPHTDNSGTSETFFKNAETDPFLGDIGEFWWGEARLEGVDPNDPYASPLLADLKGLPPLLIQASTNEMLYDHSTRFAKKAKAAGVDVTLETWDDMIHVFQAFPFPESKEAISNVQKFVKKLFS